MSLSCALVLMCLLPLAVSGWWPFSSGDSNEAIQPEQASLGGSKKVAQFEMMSAEQKFLSEAQQFLDLSPLDKCLHGVREPTPTR